MPLIISLWQGLLHAIKNLSPIIIVVGLFQWLVFGQWPENLASLIGGLAIVAVGIALFLQGLEYSVFPVGKSLANQFARRGSMLTLMFFGFALGFSAVIAEPALIAIAEQAQLISEGRIRAGTLRVLVALSVGLVIALGVFRIILGHALRWYMVVGYSLVVLVTFFAPPEIVGLAYDSGGVTTNIVTVPLIAALGIGLASSIAGRNPLIDGFGLVAMAVMVPMIVVQLYGIWVYQYQTPSELTMAADMAVASPWWLSQLWQLLTLIGDLLPIIVVVLFFQFLILRRPLPNAPKVVLGFVMVVFGLYAFVLGLKLGLFPLGEQMARQLIERDNLVYLYIFALAIGFATTMAEPALIAVGQQAQQVAPGRLNAQLIRVLVAVGVAVGITLGVHRIITGDSMHYYIIASYLLVIVLTFLSPKYIVALAFDLGGVTTSEVTVPLITALGIGLATFIPNRDLLIDGFGLIAFASIFPIVSLMLYAISMEFYLKLRESRR